MKRLIPLALCLVAGCAGPSLSPPDGYWRYVHDTNGPQDTQSDLAMCEVGWLSSGMAVELERQLAAPLEKDAYGNATWASIFRKKQLRERKWNAEVRHVRTCMRALRYERRWFDSEGCQRGCPYMPESVLR